MGRPLSTYFPDYDDDEEAQRERRKKGLWINTKCEICDVAFEMGLSEDQFLARFGPGEREQILATYRSRQKRMLVMLNNPATTGQ